MWSIIWYIITFIGGLFFAFWLVGVLNPAGEEDEREEQRALGRIRLSKEKGRKAQKAAEKLEEKHGCTFPEFEESIEPDEKLKDYAEWTFWRRTMEDAKKEIEKEQKLFP